MSRLYLLCEGPEDLAALRETLKGRFGFLKMTGDNLPRREQWSRGDLTLELVAVEGKAQVVQKAVTITLADSAHDPIVRFGLSFDPNGQAEEKWRSWLEEALRDLSLSRTGWDYTARPAGRVPLEVHPIPWSWTGSPRYGLDDSHCLERIAVDVLATESSLQHERVARWMDELRAGAGVPPTWKTAARLWNALVLPEVSGAGFYSKVFGQRAETARLFGEKLPTTELGTALAKLLRSTP